jgi:hypothetical protein
MRIQGVDDGTVVLAGQSQDTASGSNADALASEPA